MIIAKSALRARWLSIISYNQSNIFARARLVYTRHVGEYSPAKTGNIRGYSPIFKTDG